MKNILKRNQIMITALAIMIAVAGYLNFTGSKLGEEELLTTAGSDVVAETANGDTDLANKDALDISAEDTEQAALTDIESLDSEVVLEDTAIGEEDLAVTVLPQEDGAASDTAAVPGAAELADAGDELKAADTPGEAVFTASSVGNLASAKLVKEQTRAKNKETLLEIINNASIESTQKQDAIDNMIELTDVAEKEMSAEILLEAKGFKNAVVSISDGFVDVCVSAGELSDAQRAQIEDIVKRKTGVVGENIIITPI